MPIGDVQGCERELRALLKKVGFSADRDRLWFVGDLVNRGPRSLETLRLRARAAATTAVIVLGNHDLHLLALAYGAHRRRRSDTLDAVLAASDRDALLEWLAGCPLAHAEGARSHGARRARAAVERGARRCNCPPRSARRCAATRRRCSTHMYGDEPDGLGRRPQRQRAAALHDQCPHAHAPVHAPTAASTSR